MFRTIKYLTATNKITTLRINAIEHLLASLKRYNRGLALENVIRVMSMPMASFSSLVVAKTKSLPQSGATERCFPQVGSGLTLHQGRDKHSRLIQKFIKALGLDPISLQPSNLKLLIFQNFAAKLFSDAATEEDLAGQYRVVWIGDVVLADVPVKPVGHVQVLVIHRDLKPMLYNFLRP